MATDDENGYVGPVGPNGIRVWRPTPYSINSAQVGGSPSSNTGSGGTTTPPSGGTDGQGNVYAAALFFSATCQSSDQVGAFVRADAGTNAVTTATCFQPYPAIGCIVSKSSSTACVVQTYGLCGAIYSGLSANSRYFVGPSGTPVLATALPGNAPYVQAIGFAVQPAKLFVQPSGTIYRRDTANPSPPDPDAGDTVSSYYGGLLHGSDAPASDLGQENDSYLQTGTSPVLWGPKTADGWGPSGVSLQGPVGRGNRIFWGDGPPTNDLGQQADDAYIDRQTGTLYQAA